MTTKKGNAWYFGMTVGVGTDVKGLVRHLTVTDAAQAEISRLTELPRVRERALYGDKAYRCEGDRQDLEAIGIR